MKRFLILACTLATGLLAGCGGTGDEPTESGDAPESVFIGQLVDYTGPTAFVGLFYGPGVADAIAWINANGGAGGVMIELHRLLRSEDV